MSFYYNGKSSQIASSTQQHRHMNSDLLWITEEAELNSPKAKLHPEVVSSFAIVGCRQDHSGKPARIHLALKLCFPSKRWKVHTQASFNQIMEMFLGLEKWDSSKAPPASTEQSCKSSDSLLVTVTRSQCTSTHLQISWALLLPYYFHPAYCNEYMYQ